MTGWWDRALCRKSRNPNLWYDPATVEQAKAVCRRCPVRAECLAEARATGEQRGVWGGLTPAERGGSVTDRERQRVLDEVRGGASSVREVMVRLGTDVDATRGHLRHLERDGLVVVVQAHRGAPMRVRPVGRVRP